MPSVRREMNCIGRAIVLVSALACPVTALGQPGGSKKHYTAPYNVVWTSPSHDAAGSMPLGNGQVGINLWVEEDGDLSFYISRNDSYTEVSRLVKVGGVRISLDPNPFKKGMPFRQVLHLADGTCEIVAGDEACRTSITIFVELWFACHLLDWRIERIAGEG